MHEIFTLSDEERNIFVTACLTRPSRAEPVILLVEDQRFFQQVFRSALGMGRPMLIAKDAMEAWALYIKHAPDIAFIDVHMAGIDGHALTVVLGAIDRDAYLVMLTAAQDIESMAAALENGAREYITKPYTQKKLGDCLARYAQANQRA